VSGADEPTTPGEAARAVGLEVSRERYLRTLDRVRRCGRATRLAALLGPLGPSVPGTDRRSVVVASADAREVLGKLWTAGERYRLVLAALGGDADRVDPGAGHDDEAFAELRGRLASAPRRARAGDYGAVSAAMRDARAAIRALLDAREADCEALSAFDPDRLRRVAGDAATALGEKHEARREATRERAATPEDGAESAGDEDDEDDESEADTEPEPEPEPEATPDETRAAEDDDAAPAAPEEVIGARFEIAVDDGTDDPDDEDGGFEFNVVVEADDDRD
jgi:hypothetical protein